MDCRIALELLDGVRPGISGVPEDRLLEAEAHAAGCDRCAAVLRNRRQLDLKIGRIFRAVEVPREAQNRLLARLAELEQPASAVAEAPVGSRDGKIQPLVGSAAADGSGTPPDAEARLRDGFLQPAAPASVLPVVVHASDPSAPGRRIWKGLMPVAACLIVAAAGFFGAVWLLTPRWTIESVSAELAEVDFGSLQNLTNNAGEKIALPFPIDANWRTLVEPSGRHAFAVYGFLIRNSKRREPIRVLLAVVPRHRLSAPPVARSLSDAAADGYITAGSTEWIRVSWSSGDAVCVCLVEGGAESLNLLQRMLQPPAA